MLAFEQKPAAVPFRSDQRREALAEAHPVPVIHADRRAVAPERRFGALDVVPCEPSAGFEFQRAAIVRRAPERPVCGPIRAASRIDVGNAHRQSFLSGLPALTAQRDGAQAIMTDLGGIAIVAYKCR